jgi:hypothetical protein
VVFTKLDKKTTKNCDSRQTAAKEYKGKTNWGREFGRKRENEKAVLRIC